MDTCLTEEDHFNRFRPVHILFSDRYRMLDHLIIGQGVQTSLAERGLM